MWVLNLRSNIKLLDLAIAARQQQEQFALPAGDIEAPDEEELGYQSTFEPLPPDKHTTQENIDQLWGDEKPITKKEAEPLTDSDFETPVKVDLDPVNIEGSNAWFCAKMEKLSIRDKGVKDYLVNKMGLQLEDGPVSVTIAKLSNEQRTALVNVFKRKEAESKINP